MNAPRTRDPRDERIPTLLLGGSGYVAGELLRILAGHPAFRVDAVISGSRAAETVGDVFPHLRGTAVAAVALSGADAIERALTGGTRVAVFSALPHGEAATRIDSLLAFASAAGCELSIVDLSADFRHRHAELYAEIYGRPHGAPERLADFHCGLPEHAPRRPPRHVAHPGCFTTAATLALVPLVAGNWIEPQATVVAVTGSTGAGRATSPSTHHPERRSDLFAYAPLAHRHEPEMRTLIAAAAGKSQEPRIRFVAHAGPFARGIHATIAATLARPASADDLRHALASGYAEAPFVHVGATPPRLVGVVGSNRCELALAVRGDELVLFAAIDNLTKGAAGGAVQWMNRLFGLPEATGLDFPGLGWL